MVLALILALASSPDAWVIFHDDGSVTMHGEPDDIARARQKVAPGTLWFRHGGKEYAVRNDKAVAEINDLARQQGELGADQGKLGRAQGELGRQQGWLGHKQAHAGDAEHRELGRAQQVLGREQSRIGKEQAKMGEKQAALSRELQRKVDDLIETSLKDGSAKPL